MDWLPRCWQDWGSFAMVVQAIVLVIASLYAGCQLREVARSRKLDATRQLLDEIGNPVLRNNRDYVLYRLSIPEALDCSVGILVEPTAKSLTNAITRLYNKPNELMKLASNCRAYAQKRFSDDNAKLIEETYFACLK